MNERIDKLLVKAGADFGGEGVVYDSFDPKKFAQLIVAECAYIALTDGQETGNFEVFNKITKHFGVEEK
jgi:tellurite resistance protein